MKCLICKQKNFARVSERIREGKRNVFQCQGCGFVFLEPIKDSVDYTKDYGAKLFDDSWDLDAAMKARAESLKKTIDDIDQELMQTPGLRCLEIGAGVGASVYGLKQKNNNYAVDVIEPNAKLKDHLTSVFDPINVYTSFSDIKKTYNAIYGIHVFEHFLKPYEQLAIIEKCAAPKARLYLQFPNWDDYYLSTLEGTSLRNYIEFMLHTAHDYYYSIKNIERLFKQTNWDIVKIWTMQDYSIANYYHWIFCGQPMKNIAVATEMGHELREVNNVFHKALEQSSQGNNLCCLLQRKD